MAFCEAESSYGLVFAVTGAQAEVGAFLFDWSALDSFEVYDWTLYAVELPVVFYDFHGDEGAESEAWLVDFSEVDVSFSFHSHAPLIELLCGFE